MTTDTINIDLAIAIEEIDHLQITVSSLRVQLEEAVEQGYRAARMAEFWKQKAARLNEQIAALEEEVATLKAEQGA